MSLKFVSTICWLFWLASPIMAASPKIAYYGTLQSGLEEAKRSGRPIMFVSAAPHCHGVSGIW
jgi:acid phosphatase class B